MALDPTMMEAETTDPMEEEATDVESSGQAGICVEIHCNPDGSYGVVVEPLSGEEEQSEEVQPAGSLGEALKMVMAAVKDWQGESESGADDQMAAGFKGVRG